MCRWLTYMGRPTYLDALLFEPEHSLIKQSLRAERTTIPTNGDGFGVGWYGERDVPGIYREILPAWNDPNLKSLAHQIRSRLFFAHVRASTGTETSRVNCHPFVHGPWMFMHNGQIGGYARLRRSLEALIPDSLYGCRRGTTDSEAFFYLLFRFGVEQDPATAFARTIDAVQTLMSQEGIAEPFRMTAILTDGRSVTALRYSTDPVPPSLYWRCAKDEFLIVSEPLDKDLSQWNEVPAGMVLRADSGCAADLSPLAA